MQLLKRFGYYLLGIALGVPLVLFIWKGKNVSFDYGPNARTLKTIRIRKRVFSEKAKQTMLQQNIDTSQISTILKTGNVDFGKSKPRQKPCAEYFIESEKLNIYVIRCDSTSTVNKILVK